MSSSAQSSDRLPTSRNYISHVSVLTGRTSRMSRRQQRAGTYVESIARMKTCEFDDSTGSEARVKRRQDEQRLLVLSLHSCS